MLYCIGCMGILSHRQVSCQASCHVYFHNNVCLDFHPSLCYTGHMIGLNSTPLPSGKRTFTVTELQRSHREILRLAVTGMKGTDIARVLGVSPAMVYYTLDSPVVERRLEEMQSAKDIEAVDIGKRIQEIARDAIEVMGTIIADTTSDMSLRSKVSIDILDRAGFGAVKKQRIEGIHAYLSRQDIEDIKSASKERLQIEGGNGDGDVLDLETVDTEADV